MADTLREQVATLIQLANLQEKVNAANREHTGEVDSDITLLQEIAAHQDEALRRLIGILEQLVTRVAALEAHVDLEPPPERPALSLVPDPPQDATDEQGGVSS
jgi:transposase